MERIYNKLVRDKIPNIIKEKGETPIIKTLEVIESNGNDRIEELADMLEVIKALAKLEKRDLNDVLTIADEKSKKRGGFEEKIFLEKVIESK